MDILVCVKRVPATGAKISLTADERAIETRNLGFTISPHEECAVEEAVQLVEKHGGSATVLTLGEPVAVAQLRDAMALGVDRAIHLESDKAEWGPMQTAVSISNAIRAQQEAGVNFDVLLFGNESADSGGYQVGIRVAQALDLPCVTGVKNLEIDGDISAGSMKAVARKEMDGGWEQYEVSLPALFTVKEGINLPRYPSLPGRLKAKRKPVEVIAPDQGEGRLAMRRLVIPKEQESKTAVLGNGVDAVPQIIEILEEMGAI